MVRCGHDIKKVAPSAKRTPEFKRTYGIALKVVSRPEKGPPSDSGVFFAKGATLYFIISCSQLAMVRE